MRTSTRAEPLQSEAGRRRVAIETELVHRRRQGPHRPPRPGTRRRQADGRQVRRTRLKPRPDALQTPGHARGDPQRRKSGVGAAWIGGLFRERMCQCTEFARIE